MDEPLPGRDGSAPEHQSRPLRVCNPFHTDIYYIGNVIRKEFMEVHNRVTCYHNWYSSSFTELRRLRIHGGFDRLDDPRRPGVAPSDRRCTAGAFSYPGINKQEQATVRDYLKKCSQDLADNSTSRAIRPQSVVHLGSPTMILILDYLLQLRVPRER
jgi:hypothetical protein